MSKRKIFLGFIIGVILTITTTVVAANAFNAKDVLYDNESSKLTSTNVQNAIDELNDKAKYYCPEGKVCTKVWNFDYTGGEQVFEVPTTGTYILETWGAQGGSYNDTYYGGYGAYSFGTIELTKNSVLFINVGGAGSVGDTFDSPGGYNGGGKSLNQDTSLRIWGSGGGATHVATRSGLLRSLENYKSDILIVSGGGGGSFFGEYNWMSGIGGSGGGFKGTSGVSGTYLCGSAGSGGTQNSGGSAFIDSTNNSWCDTLVESGMAVGSFGQGGTSELPSTGGGGGLYGGGGSAHVAAGAGGSGYIGNPSLTNKYMYCYNCVESSTSSTKTISTTNVSNTAQSKYAKIGNGYARITHIIE